MKCQACGYDKLIERISLGYFPTVNALQSQGQPVKEEKFYPAQLFECEKCSLVQMGCQVSQSELFMPDYPYQSGTTKIIRDNFAELAKQVKAMVQLKPDDLVVDIGSNDGELLSNFKYDCQVLGVEPTEQAERARGVGIHTYKDFFGGVVTRDILLRWGKAKVITCCNCFAHMPNINGVMESIKMLLRDDGLLVLENHSLSALLDTLQYDTIYHEHLRYYSIPSLRNLLERHGFAIDRIQSIPTHGGSHRVFVSKSQIGITELGEEAKAVNDKAWENFRTQVVRSRISLLSTLKILSEMREVYGIGAPSRSTILLHYTGAYNYLTKVVEVNPQKIGKYVPGTLLPIDHEDELYRNQPPYALLLSWHIADELIPKIREKGFKGKFIVPLPKVRIV